jgi:hypothetical protein
MKYQQLAEAVSGILIAAGIPRSPTSPYGHPIGDGFTVDELPSGKEPRAAVRWHPPGDTNDLTAELAGCQKVLADAGYRTQLVDATPRLYLAVMPPAATQPERLHHQ